MFIKLIGRTVKFEIAGWENWKLAVSSETELASWSSIQVGL